MLHLEARLALPGRAARAQSLAEGSPGVPPDVLEAAASAVGGARGTADQRFAALARLRAAEAAGKSAPPKRPFEPYHARSVPRGEDLESHAEGRAEHAGLAKKTTLMLRNIPNRYSQQTLLREVNAKGFAGTYDFFYLPMDVQNRGNVGYAFFNFVQPEDVERFRCTFSDYPFRLFSSRKVAVVSDAYVQGLEKNLRHFENRLVTQARNEQYRPVVFEGGVRLRFEDALAKLRDAGLDAKRSASMLVAGRQCVRGGSAAVQSAKLANHCQSDLQAAVASPAAAQPLTASIRDSLTSTTAWGSEEGGLDGRVGLEAAIQNLLVSRSGRQALASAPLGSASHAIPPISPPIRHRDAGSSLPAYVNRCAPKSAPAYVEFKVALPHPAIVAVDDEPLYVDLKRDVPKLPLAEDHALVQPTPSIGEGDATPRTCGLHLPAALGEMLPKDDMTPAYVDLSTAVPEFHMSEDTARLAEPDPADLWDGRFRNLGDRGSARTYIDLDAAVPSS